MSWFGPSHALMFDHMDGGPVGGAPRMLNLEPLPPVRLFHEVDTTPPMPQFRLYNPVKPWFETLELASTPVPALGETLSPLHGFQLTSDPELAFLPLPQHRPRPGVEYDGLKFLDDGMYGNLGRRERLRPDAPVLLGECNGDRMYAPHDWMSRVAKSGRGRFGHDF